MRYPLIELAICILFLLCCLHFSFGWLAGCWALLCFLLLGLAVMDAETLLLPDWFTLPGLVAGIVFAGLRPGFETGSGPMPPSYVRQGCLCWPRRQRQRRCCSSLEPIG